MRTVLIYPTQGIERAWPAIDKVTDKYQAVAPGDKIKTPEQRLQFSVAPLNITDHISRHTISQYSPNAALWHIGESITRLKAGDNQRD
jgi:hypothetical protein